LQALLYNAQLEAIHETIDTYSRIRDDPQPSQNDKGYSRDFTIVSLNDQNSVAFSLTPDLKSQLEKKGTCVKTCFRKTVSEMNIGFRLAI